MSHKANYWLASLGPEQVKAGAFRVLFHLCDHHNDERDPASACFPSQETLREKTGLSNGALNDALNTMEEAGLIMRRRSTVPGTATQRTYYILGCDFGALPEQTPKNGVCSNSGGPEFAGEQTPVFGGANSGGPESILKVTENTTTAHARGAHLASRCIEVCGPGLCGEGRKALSRSGAVIERWMRDGYDLEQDILPVLKRRTAEPRDGVIRSWRYFTDAIRAHHAQRVARADASQNALKKHVSNVAPDSDPLTFLAKWINSGARVPPSAINNTQRDALIARGLVSRERLRELQIY